jgi:Zinc finger, C2H2 type
LVVDPIGYAQPLYIPPAVQDTLPETALELSVRKWPCPAGTSVCPASFRRWQDQERHILTHLPHWICCLDPGCSWRGDRRDALKNHWREKHPSSSQEQEHDMNGSMIYDPEPLVEGIITGSISIEEAQSVAESVVERKAQELNKLATWRGDLWGRRTRRRG